jgi:hypothetical protein
MEVSHEYGRAFQHEQAGLWRIARSFLSRGIAKRQRRGGITMGTLPPTLQEKKLRNICLILEGFEEYYYFKRILEFPCFNGTYNVDIRNAKAASNIPSFFQAAYAKNFYEIVFVVCDKDRNPEQYVNIISKLDDILGPGKAKEIVIFTCPCTLQVILSHFGDVQLTTQAKKAARDDVQRLTDVANYDAHQDQLKTICSKIHYRSYEKMKQRIAQLSTCPDDIPSTNILSLFGYLESQNPQWIDGINERLSAED